MNSKIVSIDRFLTYTFIHIHHIIYSLLFVLTNWKTFCTCSLLLCNQGSVNPSGVKQTAKHLHKWPEIQYLSNFAIIKGRLEIHFKILLKKIFHQFNLTLLIIFKFFRTKMEKLCSQFLIMIYKGPQCNRTKIITTSWWQLTSI